MRPALVTTFHDTVRFCFNSVLEMTGTSIRDVVYERLERLRIPATCLVSTSTQGNANNVQLAAATFTAITLPVGDTIQNTWSIPWTWP